MSTARRIDRLRRVRKFQIQIFDQIKAHREDEVRRSSAKCIA